MVKLKVNKSNASIEEDSGIVYLLYFELDGKQLVKIGITTRAIEDRVSEILVSIFKKYREFPYCRPKRFKKTGNIHEKEAQLHKYFSEFRYTTSNVFSGSTEFFDVPLDTVVEVYERLLSGEDIFDEGG